jgi:hypothetical protein
VLDFDYEALKRYNDELTSGQERVIVHGTLKDVELAKAKSRLAAAVYGIMLYEGIGLPKAEESGIDWMLQADREGSDLAYEKLTEVEVETGLDLELPDQPFQPLHASSLWLPPHSTDPFT